MDSIDTILPKFNLIFFKKANVQPLPCLFVLYECFMQVSPNSILKIYSSLLVSNDNMWKAQGFSYQNQDLYLGALN